MNDFFALFRNPKLHAAFFTYKGVRYVFSGWWMLEWDDGRKFYDSIDDFLNDRFFDGKLLKEIADEVTDVDYDLEP